MGYKIPHLILLVITTNLCLTFPCPNLKKAKIETSPLLRIFLEGF